MKTFWFATLAVAAAAVAYVAYRKAKGQPVLPDVMGHVVTRDHRTEA